MSGCVGPIRRRHVGTAPVPGLPTAVKKRGCGHWKGARPHRRGVRASRIQQVRPAPGGYVVEQLAGRPGLRTQRAPCSGSWRSPCPALVRVPGPLPRAPVPRGSPEPPLRRSATQQPPTAAASTTTMETMKIMGPPFVWRNRPVVLVDLYCRLPPVQREARFLLGRRRYASEYMSLPDPSTVASRADWPTEHSASEPSWTAPFTGLSSRCFGKPLTALRREGAEEVRR